MKYKEIPLIKNKDNDVVPRDPNRTNNEGSLRDLHKVPPTTNEPREYFNIEEQLNNLRQQIDEFQNTTSTGSNN